MADFPLSGHAEAVSKIISSVIPPKSYAYFTPFLPGLYFQVCIFLGNPEDIHQLILKSNQAVFLGRYLKIGIAVFLAFVLGHAFILWVGIVHRILAMVYRVSGFLRRRACEWLLLPVLNKPSVAKSWLGRRSWFAPKVLRPLQDVASGVDDDSEPVRRLWARLSRHLFKKSYDIELHDLSQAELNALYVASRSVPLIQLPNHLLMVATQALGWGGVAAVQFAPSLANKNYVGFNLILIAFGLLYDWRLVRSQNEATYGFLKVRALLRDMRKDRRIKDSPKPPNEHPLA